jgi:hypothetical protein
MRHYIEPIGTLTGTETDSPKKYGRGKDAFRFANSVAVRPDSDTVDGMTGPITRASSFSGLSG